MKGIKECPYCYGTGAYFKWEDSGDMHPVRTTVECIFKPEKEMNPMTEYMYGLDITYEDKPSFISLIKRLFK